MTDTHKPDYKERSAIAFGIYNEGLKRVSETPPPQEQKYLPGTRVRISDKFPDYMSHFSGAGKLATVQYTYAHAYGGNDIKSYSLDIDGIGFSAWYDENLLTEIPQQKPEEIAGEGFIAYHARHGIDKSSFRAKESVVVKYIFDISADDPSLNPLDMGWRVRPCKIIFTDTEGPK